jgi:peptide/nickel transport system permease protein
VLRFIIRRLLLLAPILLGLSILVFAWTRALPGGPAVALLGAEATSSRIEAVEQQYGLDRPLPVQYWEYLSALGRLDLGESITSRQPVIDEIFQRFPATMELALAGMAFAVAVGVPLGFLAAKRHGGWLDNASLMGSLLGISVPVFLLGLLLKYVFAVKLGWLPTVGRASSLSGSQHPTGFYVLDAIVTLNGEALWDAVRHLILPAITLGAIPLAAITRITRAAALDVQNEDYVETARAKGLTPGVIDRRHVLRNAMLPISTMIGLMMSLALGGAVLTERVFAWPGMGTWLIDALADRDYPVVQGGILFLAVVVIVVNLLVDVSYGFLNPKVRLR